MAKEFKYSGLIADDDWLHKPMLQSTYDRLMSVQNVEREKFLESIGEPNTIIAPTYVDVPGSRKVPQWSPTVTGDVVGYSPSSDCGGNFTSSRFQPNNNCYNYACNVATNSFAQPGRKHGLFLADNWSAKGQDVVQGAQLDGLSFLGDSTLKLSDLPNNVQDHRKGHVVALLMSAAINAVGWKGDYHWVRADDRRCSSWSQKDGSDQVTDFDFAGRRITDPTLANWTVNQGPISKKDPRDLIVKYVFYAWMFVPAETTDII